MSPVLLICFVFFDLFLLLLFVSLFLCCFFVLFCFVLLFNDGRVRLPRSVGHDKSFTLSSGQGHGRTCSVQTEFSFTTA